MVRPRVGDFVYNHHELDIMLEDIESFKELRIRGFVVGALTKGGTVDIDGMKRYVRDRTTYSLVLTRPGS